MYLPNYLQPSSLPTYLSICLSVRPSIHPPIRRYVSLSMHRSMHPSTSSIYLSIYLFVCLSVCLSVSLYLSLLSPILLLDSCLPIIVITVYGLTPVMDVSLSDTWDPQIMTFIVPITGVCGDSSFLTLLFVNKPVEHGLFMWRLPQMEVPRNTIFCYKPSILGIPYE